MQSNEKGSLICAPEVQAILPFVPLLENLKYKFLREDGEMILRRGEEKVKVHKDNNVFECDRAEGEKLMRELESLTEPVQGHDALVAAWKVVRQEKAKILARMKGLREFLGPQYEQEEQGGDPSVEERKEKLTSCQTLPMKSQKNW